LQSLLTDAQTKLDTLAVINTTTETRDREPAQTLAEVVDQATDVLPLSPPELAADPVEVAQAIVNFDQEIARVTRQRERDAWTYGGVGVMAGMICTLFVAALGR
jgi:hypothetical protein